MTDLTMVSLFSGGGGLDYGLALAGFQTLLAVEQEPYACQVLHDAKDIRVTVPDGYAYLSRCHIWKGDIADLTDDEALRLAGVKHGEITLLVGGPPCVTFSVAGRREGLSHETGQLYRHYIRLLRAFGPRAFIFENVKGLLTAQVDGDDDATAFEVILAALKDAGYAITWQVVDAADYGVPQHRHRVIIIGQRGNTPLRFAGPTHAPPEKTILHPALMPWRTVRDAFDGLPPAVPLGEAPALPNHLAKRHSQAMIDSYRATPPGTRNQASKRDKLLWNAPAKTVRAQGKPKADGSGQKNSSHQALHPEEPRQLTPRECARLQTFPDWYPLPTTLVNSYRIVGDAVPCELARVIGESIKTQLVSAHSEVVDVSDCRESLDLRAVVQIELPFEGLAVKS